MSNFDKRISWKSSNIEKFELDEGFQPYHPPFRNMQLIFLEAFA